MQNKACTWPPSCCFTVSGMHPVHKLSHIRQPSFVPLRRLNLTGETAMDFFFFFTLRGLFHILQSAMHIRSLYLSLLNDNTTASYPFAVSHFLNVKSVQSHTKQTALININPLDGNIEKFYVFVEKKKSQLVTFLHILHFAYRPAPGVTYGYMDVLCFVVNAPRIPVTLRHV